jgi:hypothetical protein
MDAMANPNRHRLLLPDEESAGARRTRGVHVPRSVASACSQQPPSTSFTREQNGRMCWTPVSRPKPLSTLMQGR